MDFMKLSALIIAAIILCPIVLAQLPEPSGFVNDYAGVLGAYSGQTESLVRDIESSTSAEIAVVTIPKLPEGYDIVSYGVDLFEKWGIGKRGKDNGVLVLISIEEKKWRIEVGYGLEGNLNDAKVGKIGRETLEKAFETGEYGSEVYNAVQMIRSEIEPATYEADPTQEIVTFIQNNPLTVAIIAILIVGGIVLMVITGNGWILFIIVRIIMMILTRGRFGGGRSGGGGAGRFIKTPVI